MTIAFRGKTPQTDKAAFVAPNATLCGDVRLEEGVTIWFGAVARTEYDEPMVIGKDSNVQDNCVLHCAEGYPLTIGSGVSVGHGAILHGATIGDDVLIGMGATVLNGAVIGKGAVIAAGALVKEHMEVPENALVVGIPAKVVRINAPEAAESNRENARHYVELGHEYSQLVK